MPNVTVAIDKRWDGFLTARVKQYDAAGECYGTDLLFPRLLKDVGSAKSTVEQLLNGKVGGIQWAVKA